MCLKVQELRPKLLQPTPPDPNHAGLYTRKHTHTQSPRPASQKPKEIPEALENKPEPSEGIVGITAEGLGAADAKPGHDRFGFRVPWFTFCVACWG